MRGKVFLIGFEQGEVEKIRKALKGFDVYEIPEYCRDWALQEIIEKADKLEGSGDWHVKRFFLMHEIGNDDVKNIIKKIRAMKIGRMIFASTTPTSLTWKLDDLIKEWIKEDNYFQEMQASRFYLDIKLGKG